MISTKSAGRDTGRSAARFASTDGRTPSWSPQTNIIGGMFFFANDPELVSQTRLKVSRPLFAVVVRLAARAASHARLTELIRTLAGALRPFGNIQGNQLVPLTNDDYHHGHYLLDLVFRETHRSGMLLNSDELVAMAHLPTAAVRSKGLRRALQRTKPVPAFLVGADAGGMDRRQSA